MQNHEIKKATKHLAKQDKVLSTIIKNIGIINLTPHTKYFNPLLKAIISQQLSTYSADAIYKRFIQFFNGKPHPESILRADDSVLRSLGLSNAKVKYVKDFSNKIISKEITLVGMSKKSDERIIEELTKVKGIGIWTVHMFLIFSLGRKNVLPFSDLGIRKAIMLNYALKKLPDEKKITRLAAMNNWHPYCSIASLYLWRSLEL